MRLIGEEAFLGACPVINDTGIYVDGHRVIRFGGVGSVGVGALERRNPVPPGKYWFDTFETIEPNEAFFQDWLRRNKGNVAVLTTETFPENAGGPARTWRLFEVRAPVNWEPKGFPTIAAPGTETSEDTGQRPDPEMDPIDKLTEFYGGGTAKTAFWVIGAVVAVVIGGVIVAKLIVPQRAAPTPAPAPYT